jgi:hypothetical protein
LVDSESAGKDAESDDDFWTLHNFVADLVIECKEGYIAGTNPMEDRGLFRVLNQRSGAISAAISITIDAPAGAGQCRAGHFLAQCLWFCRVGYTSP